jgi:ribonuclease HII
LRPSLHFYPEIIQSNCHPTTFEKSRLPRRCAKRNDGSHITKPVQIQSRYFYHEFNTAKWLRAGGVSMESNGVPRRTFMSRRFCFEQELLDKGMALIAGVDEAGRGPLAGPVVAAAVIFPVEWIARGLPAPLRKINDSKQLSPAARENFYIELTSRAEIQYGIAQADALLIDEINILQATHHAMNLALAQLQPPPQHALVDGLRVHTLRWPHTAIVSGDALSYSIAAASILAKVTRDRQMVEFDRQYPGYGFAGHKGYGTPEHLAMLKERGACPIHRQSFAPVRTDQLEFL